MHAPPATVSISIDNAYDLCVMPIWQNCNDSTSFSTIVRFIAAKQWNHFSCMLCSTSSRNAITAPSRTYGYTNKIPNFELCDPWDHWWEIDYGVTVVSRTIYQLRYPLPDTQHDQWSSTLYVIFSKSQIASPLRDSGNWYRDAAYSRTFEIHTYSWAGLVVCFRQSRVPLLLRSVTRPKWNTNGIAYHCSRRGRVGHLWREQRQAIAVFSYYL